jgi:hypothetical protein
MIALAQRRRCAALLRRDVVGSAAGAFRVLLAVLVPAAHPAVHAYEAEHVPRHPVSLLAAPAIEKGLSGHPGIGGPGDAQLTARTAPQHERAAAVALGQVRPPDGLPGAGERPAAQGASRFVAAVAGACWSGLNARGCPP